jgi:MEMO1 family protein
MAGTVIHLSPLAGTWYPKDRCELQDLLSAAFERSALRTGEYARPGGAAFLVPHAAPRYSGTVAAAAYRHMRWSRAERVIILGFSHRRTLAGIAIPEADEIETPLGAVRVDPGTARMLARVSPFHMMDADHACDHSVEIQLPFLQTVLPHAAILPLYVGRLSEDERRAAAHCLRDLMDGETLLMASSDLTHYGRDFGYVPFKSDDRLFSRLRTLDRRMLEAAASLDARFFEDELEATGSTVCGRAPMALLLETLSECSGAEIFQETLDYDTSGAMTSDYEHSVSYGAAGYFRATAYQLNAPDRAELLALAREALGRFCTSGLTALDAPEPAGGELKQPGRAFVTLHAGDALRGCVGRFMSAMPLSKLVPELTVAAATEDPRFEPVGRGERLSIEVHVLTPLKRIRDPADLVTGEHGGYLQHGTNCGLLLPPVARRHHLDRAAFLRALAQKAELPESVYSTANARLYVFRDQSFREP